MNSRERWIALSGLLLGIGLSFTVVDFIVLLIEPAGIRPSSMRTVFDVGLLITALSAVAASLINIWKLRQPKP